jgi:hypothetical protein
MEVEEGDLVPTGRVTFGTGHASLTASRTAVAEHYDNTGSVVADVRASDGKFGVWIAGAFRPDTSPERLRQLRDAALSGDWRNIRGSLEMLGLLAVNVPGFPVPRRCPRPVTPGQPLVLVAAGITTGWAEWEKPDWEPPDEFDISEAMAHKKYKPGPEGSGQRSVPAARAEGRRHGPGGYDRQRRAVPSHAEARNGLRRT